MITIESYDICAVFPADIFVMRKPVKLSITYKIAQTSHYINLGPLLETHWKASYEAPRHGLIQFDSLSVRIMDAVAFSSIYIPLALQ